MDDVKTDRFAVLSPKLVVPRLEDIEQRFIATWVRMKQNVRPGYRRAQLSYQDERKAKGFAANAHARRLREAGLSSLPKDAHVGVMSLARDGAALSGPATDDSEYPGPAASHDFRASLVVVFITGVTNAPPCHRRPASGFLARRRTGSVRRA